MKYLLIASFLMFFSTALSAQFLKADGGGEVVFGDQLDSMTEEQRLEIRQLLARRIDSLSVIGKISPSKRNLDKYSWPVKQAEGVHGFGYHRLGNFVDHDTRTQGFLSDYMCGTRSYDRVTGYNHSGTDISNWPFKWYKMDHDQVEVVAVAPGVIIEKRDGNFDRSCSFGGSSWNAVYVQNYDGNVVWYGHLKTNSLTSKKVGDEVKEGEFLGVVGSSGSSTAPHLHIEFYDEQGMLIDPYVGPCNDTVEESLWKEQRPYYDSKINALHTHGIPPEFYFDECPKTELPNFKNAFFPGDTVRSAAYYRDQREGRVSSYAILKPDSSTFSTWTHEISEEFYEASYWYWTRVLPDDAHLGIWTFQVEYEGEMYTHQFSVSDTSTAPMQTSLIYPVQRAIIPENKVKLEWLPLADAETYHLKIASDSLFTNVMFEDSVISESSVTLDSLDNGEYFWVVRAGNNHGKGDWSASDSFEINKEPEIETSIERPLQLIPDRIQLSQNYPNPFNPVTTISYSLTRPADVNLKVYNILGKEVSELFSGKKPPGFHEVSFDASFLPSGVYYYQLVTDEFRLTKAMTLVK